MNSPILTTSQMRAAEKVAFDRGVSAETLMDGAGAGIADVVECFVPVAGQCIVFIGKGHNGGDALVAAEHLQRRGWKIDIHLLYREEECSELTRKKLQSFQRGRSLSAPTVAARPHLVILDGLLGLGAKPPLRAPVRGACREINQLRREANAYVFAVDLPTGLDGDSGKADRDCVVADFTVTIGFAKPGLIADSATNFVGRLEVVALSELAGDGLPFARGGAEARPSEVAIPESLRGLLPRRKYEAHKNQFGHIAVVAGSRGLTGAAIMCASGALRAGVGLVRVFVAEEIYPIVAAGAPPEAMVRPVASYRELVREKIDVWAVGPGLGQSRSTEILELIEKARQPMVLDADGLNILSQKISTLKRCRGPRLVTPHPGEMKRLFSAKTKTREELARKFCKRFPVTLLFKGSRTIVAERAQPLSFNTTGNPGMATGGMGDVLTGVCAALIAQKLSPYNAGRLAAWLCGRSAELAIFNGAASEESLLPQDVLDHLGQAFKALHSASRY